MGRKDSGPDPKPFPSGLCALCGKTPDRAGGRAPCAGERLYLFAFGQRYLLQVARSLGEIQELDLLGLQPEDLRVF
jgi:hypothetical protein